MNKLTELKVSYRQGMSVSERIKIKSSKDAYEFFISIWDKDLIEIQEHFYLLLLDNANQVLGYKVLSTGGISSTIVDVRILFAIALKCCATGIIIAHNHPSGNLNSSSADKKLTYKILEAGKLIDICLLDHIILSTTSYLSMKDNGEM